MAMVAFMEFKAFDARLDCVKAGNGSLTWNSTFERFRDSLAPNAADSLMHVTGPFKEVNSVTKTMNDPTRKTRNCSILNRIVPVKSDRGGKSS
jgi:hypothetical protein